MKRYIRHLLGLLALSSSLVGCQTAQKQNHSQQDYQIYDTQGILIDQHLTQTPKKVTVIGQSIAEMMSYFDLEDRIHSLSYLEEEQITNPKLKEVPILATLWPSKEALLGQETDLLYSLSTAFDDERIGSIDQWNQRGVPVVTTSNYVIGKSIEHFFDEVRLLGEIFDCEPQTTAFIETQQERIAAIKAQSYTSQKPDVLLIATDNRGHYYYYPRHYSLVDEMVEGAGGNYLELSDTYLEISLEAIIKEDPDVILFTAFQQNDQQERPDLLTNKQLQDVKAIQNSAILDIDYMEATRGTMSFMDLYEEIATFIHPEVDTEATK